MSVRLLSKVLRDSPSRLATRLVLIALADIALDDGIAWQPQTTLAAKANVDEATVRRALRELEASGEVETRKAMRGTARINVYRLTCSTENPDYGRLPFELAAPFTTVQDARSLGGDDRTGCPVATGQDARSSRARSSLLVEQNDEQNATTDVVATARDAPSVANMKVDRKAVTADEYAAAVAILGAWNRQTGQSLAAKGWLSKIVMRIREHPQLTLHDHEQIIARNLAAPWWRGAATPSVVYGSDAQFERSMAVTGGEHVDPKKLTPEQIASGEWRNA